MTEVIIDDYDQEKKCGHCGYRYSTLYRFEGEDEELNICSGCMLEMILTEDSYEIADDAEWVVGYDEMKRFVTLVEEVMDGLDDQERVKELREAKDSVVVQ